jgi:hypothetical protein
MFNEVFWFMKANMEKMHDKRRQFRVFFFFFLLFWRFQEFLFPELFEIQNGPIKRDWRSWLRKPLDSLAAFEILFNDSHWISQPYSPEPKSGLPLHIRTSQKFLHLTALVNQTSRCYRCGKWSKLWTLDSGRLAKESIVRTRLNIYILFICNKPS